LQAGTGLQRRSVIPELAVFVLQQLD